MVILAASSNIARVAQHKSVGGDFCNDWWVEVREWPRAPISMVTNEVLSKSHFILSFLYCLYILVPFVSFLYVCNLVAPGPFLHLCHCTVPVVTNAQNYSCWLPTSPTFPPPKFYVPRFSDLEWDYAHRENLEYEQLAAFVAAMQLLMNSSRVQKRVEVAVRVYLGSKDRQFIGHWAKSCHTFAMSQWASLKKGLSHAK